MVEEGWNHAFVDLTCKQKEQMALGTEVCLGKNNYYPRLSMVPKLSLMFCVNQWQWD